MLRKETRGLSLPGCFTDQISPAKPSRPPTSAPGIADVRHVHSQHTGLPAWRVSDGQGKWAGVGAPDSPHVPISWTLDWGSHKPCKPAPATDGCRRDNQAILWLDLSTSIC